MSGQFSHDWQSPNFATWDRLLPISGVTSILEIGVYEGMATCYFLQKYPDAVVTGVDTFEGGQDHKELGLDFSGTEAKFYRNVSPWSMGKRRVSCYKGTSFNGLLWFQGNKQFDVALIDGSHLAPDVLSDAVLTWPLIKQGGIVIFDDYGWGSGRPRESTPAPAIEAFLTCYKGHYALLEHGYQCIVRKL